MLSKSVLPRTTAQHASQLSGFWGLALQASHLKSTLGLSGNQLGILFGSSCPSRSAESRFCCLHLRGTGSKGPDLQITRAKIRVPACLHCRNKTGTVNWEFTSKLERKQLLADLPLSFHSAAILAIARDPKLSKDMHVQTFDRCRSHHSWDCKSWQSFK